MAQGYSTGPVAIWLGVGQSGTPLFLGHGRKAPHVHQQRHYRMHPNDLSGEAPYDKLYTGRECTITVTMSRLNLAVLRLAQAAGSVNAVNGALPLLGEGSDPFGSVGGLMATEGRTYHLWLVYPYAAKALMAGSPPVVAGFPNGLQAGDRYLAASLVDDSVEPGTTEVYGPALTFHCISLWVPAAAAFVLYDHVMTAVPLTIPD